MCVKVPMEHDHGLRDHASHFLPYCLCPALKVNEYEIESAIQACYISLIYGSSELDAELMWPQASTFATNMVLKFSAQVYLL